MLSAKKHLICKQILLYDQQLAQILNLLDLDLSYIYNQPEIQYQENAHLNTLDNNCYWGLNYFIMCESL